MFYFLIEKLSFFLINFVVFLLCIALFTLIERKVMSSVQRRKGPNLTGLFGFLQPFADGLKLLLKEIIIPSNSNFLIFLFSPVVTFFFTIFLFFMLPFSEGYILLESSFSILFLLAVSSLSVHSIIFSGWSSNSKYAFLGSIRSASQMISYELCISTIFLSIVLITGSFSLIHVVISQSDIWFCVPLFPFFILFLITSLAETNRAPFDLPEAELVAGYNRPIYHFLYVLKNSHLDWTYCSKTPSKINYKLGTINSSSTRRYSTFTCVSKHKSNVFITQKRYFYKRSIFDYIKSYYSNFYKLFLVFFFKNRFFNYLRCTFYVIFVGNVTKKIHTFFFSDIQFLIHIDNLTLYEFKKEFWSFLSEEYSSDKNDLIYNIDGALENHYVSNKLVFIGHLSKNQYLYVIDSFFYSFSYNSNKYEIPVISYLIYSDLNTFLYDGKHDIYINCCYSISLSSIEIKNSFQNHIRSVLAKKYNTYKYTLIISNVISLLKSQNINRNLYKNNIKKVNIFNNTKKKFHLNNNLLMKKKITKTVTKNVIEKKPFFLPYNNKLSLEMISRRESIKYNKDHFKITHKICKVSKFTKKSKLQSKLKCNPESQEFFNNSKNYILESKMTVNGFNILLYNALVKGNNKNKEQSINISGQNYVLDVSKCFLDLDKKSNVNKNLFEPLPKLDVKGNELFSFHKKENFLKDFKKKFDQKTIVSNSEYFSKSKKASEYVVDSEKIKKIFLLKSEHNLVIDTSYSDNSSEETLVFDIFKDILK